MSLSSRIDILPSLHMLGYYPVLRLSSGIGILPSLDTLGYYFVFSPPRVFVFCVLEAFLKKIKFILFFLCFKLIFFCVFQSF